VTDGRGNKLAGGEEIVETIPREGDIGKVQLRSGILEGKGGKRTTDWKEV